MYGVLQMEGNGEQLVYYDEVYVLGEVWYVVYLNGKIVKKKGYVKLINLV